MSFQEIDRKAILDDEHQQRLRRIKLIERETKEQAPLWAAKQQTLFPTALPLTQTPSLGQIITEEIQNNAYDADVLYQRAEQKIKSIADNTNTQYILDRLDDQQLYYLVNSWDGIVKNLKEKYNTSGLDKNVFVQMIQDDAQNLKQTPVIAMTTRGDLRAQQKADLEKEQQAKVDAEKLRLEKEKKAFDALVIKREILAARAAARAARAAARAAAAGQPVPPAPAPAPAPPQPPAPIPQPAPAPAPPTPTPIKGNTNTPTTPTTPYTVSPSDKPFIYDPLQTSLIGNYKVDFDVEMASVKDDISKLTDVQVHDEIKRLEGTYPTRMSNVSGLTERKKLYQYFARSRFDYHMEAFIDEQKKNQTKTSAQIDIEKLKADRELLKIELQNKTRDELITLLGQKKSKKKDNIIIQNILDKQFPTIKGKGLKNRIIYGKGYTSSDEDEQPVRKNTVLKKVINGKYIDLNKLKNNILTVRYVKTGGFIPTVKSQHISNDVKSIIEDLISDKFEKRLFEKLQPDEKRLVKRLVAALKIDIDVNTKEDDEYRKQFEIILGEFQAGNTSPAIKNKLKQYVAESMQSGFLTRRECWQLLYELTINN